jgi:hypothetical protein
METLEGFALLGLVGLGLLTAAAVPFFIVERRWRWRWREVEVGRIASHTDERAIYREPGTVPAFLRQAPRLVRIAAFSCLLLGQMFVPGLLLGALGLLAGGLGVVSIPGLITAARLYGAGFALLRREPRLSYFKTRSAVQWALWLNGVILGGSLLIVTLGFHSIPTASWVGLGFTNAYGALSIGQALLCRYASGRYEDALFAPTRAFHEEATDSRAA